MSNSDFNEAIEAKKVVEAAEREVSNQRLRDLVFRGRTVNVTYDCPEAELLPEE